MERDSTTPRGGYSARSYVEVLNSELPTCYEPGMLFMQDNAPIHTAKFSTDWLENNGIAVLPWPPYSPDLNPIEHLWAIMKEWISEHYPHLQTMGKSDEDYAALYDAIERAWNAIPQSKIDTLIRSMGRRVQAVKKAKGWHTKY